MDRVAGKRIKVVGLVSEFNRVRTVLQDGDLLERVCILLLLASFWEKNFIDL